MLRKAGRESARAFFLEDVSLAYATTQALVPIKGHMLSVTRGGNTGVSIDRYSDQSEEDFVFAVLT